MRCRQDYAINRIISQVFLVQVRMCLVVIGGGMYSKMERLFFSQSRLVFLAKQCVPSPLNNIIVSVWSLKGIFRTWHQVMHFLQSYKLVFLLVELLKSKKHFSFLHVGHYTSPIVSCTLLSTFNFFFLYLFD